MNKSGQIIFYSLMLSLTIIILTLAIAPSVKQFNDTAMNESSGDFYGLDCGNESISTFQKGACVVTDISSFYFIGSLLLIGGGVIVFKIIF
jgi:hypothetical protein